MLQRGVEVGYETVRRWCAKDGQANDNELRRQRPRPGDGWHLDEVFVRIDGTRNCLWWVVDRRGVLDVVGQSRRDALAVHKRGVR